MTAKAAGLEGVVQLAHAGVDFFIHGVFGVEPHAGLAEDEGKGADVARKIAQRKFQSRHQAASKERQVALFLRFKAVENEIGEIGNEDKARNFIKPPFTRQVFDVAERLCLGLLQCRAPTFVFNDELAAPEQINGVRVALQIADVGLECGDGCAADAEDVEEYVVESLLVGALRSGFTPTAGETNSTFARRSATKDKIGDVPKSIVSSALGIYDSG